MSSWRLFLSPRSPMLVGGFADAPVGVHAATASLETAASRPTLVLPGTSLRGVLRDTFSRFAAAKGYPCQRVSDCPCPACRLFGSPDREGALWVRSSTSQGDWHLATGVSIYRHRRTAARAEGALWVERRGIADGFEVEVRVSGALDESDRSLIEDFWEWIGSVGLSVGRRKSAGAGRFDVRVVPIEPKKVSIPAPSTHDDEVVRRYLVRLRLREPARLVGVRQRDFYRDGLELIPIGTLRGAIGWALERGGASAAASDLFLERPVLLTPAFPFAGSDATVPPWLARLICDGERPHLIDGALARVARALGRIDDDPEMCPLCRAELRSYEPRPPRTLISGHVSLDPDRRRVRRGDLHYQVSVAPHSTFVCELLARPSQAEALKAIDEVLIGGRRARGMGLAAFEVEELPPLPPIRKRVEAASRRLQEKYGVDDQIAVLGLLTDAAMERPVGEILRETGLEVVTGEVRDVVRGGWDEQQGQSRALRRLLAAGSWLAVRVRSDEALDALEGWEQGGIADPEGVAPLVLRVRGDWIHENWEAMEMTTEPVCTETASELDRLVRDARRLCADAGQLPDRAALQTLLRFAQSTPSIEEIVLFIEYQASRDQHKRYAAFLRALASFIRVRFTADPEGARRFLALIVRAGYVQRRQSDGARDERRRRERSQPQGGRHDHR